MTLIVESEKTLKITFDEMERKLQEKEKQPQEKEKELEGIIVPPTVESNEQTIIQSMSQVSLKYLELARLKNQNKNMENLAVKRNKKERLGNPSARIGNPNVRNYKIKMISS